jgi:hypothetical protein
MGEPKIREEFWPNGQMRLQSYFFEGTFHNPNGPAFQTWHPNGQMDYREYRVYGVYHNLNGPAYECWSEDGELMYRMFRVDGILHNPHGPAYETPDSQEFWINGKQLTEEEFLALPATKSAAKR